MIKIDSSEVALLAKSLAQVSKNYARDRKRVLSTTRRALGTEVKRQISRVYDITQQRVTRGLKLTEVNNETLSFAIVGSKKVIGLQNFAYRPNRRDGVKVEVIKGSGFKSPSRAPGYSKAFLLRKKGQSGRAPIAQRNGGRQKGNRNRESFEILFGPSVADMMNRLVVNKGIVDFAQKKVSSELQRLIASAFKNG